ncbi:MAG: insulinase family protein [Alphaproteobacteria bacterium]|nr:insulinase family protein [Alphaproteobacteria bacterium]
MFYSRALSAGLFAVAVFAPMAATAADAARPAAAGALAKLVDIPHQKFTLGNGLRVLVHTDRKAPVVAVSVWYGVGSKHEPKGKTGFAHLFEHLMFNGSENAPGDYFEPLQQVGATDFNGTTWLDRTNYFQTVPTGALERALFLESDRMGHLLGAVTQEKLDNQRGVVQNEKRQGDNQPYGLVEYLQFESLFPQGHPYHHSTIGSMADLDAASLDDVKKWFRDNYGPNNAVLVLAGDIDVSTAKTLVEKYFGDIPRGPVVKPVNAPVSTLKAAKSDTMTDRVANTRIYRNWVVPGLNDKDSAALDVAATVLGGLASSRLDNALVRKEKIAVAVTASLQEFQHASLFEISADVKPGVEAAAVAKRLDEVLAELLRDGPTADEVNRSLVSKLSGYIRGIEAVGGFGGKAVVLAQGELFSNNSNFYKKRLAQLGSLTPAAVRKAAKKWLSRPVYALTVVPGERALDGGKLGGWRTACAVVPGSNGPACYWNAADDASGPTTAIDRSKLPDVGSLSPLDFPALERGKLSNGIPVIFAKRNAVPTVTISVSFDAGYAADPKSALGTQSLMLSLLPEGTTSRSSVQIAEENERLGSSIQTAASLDRTAVTMSALTPNLVLSVRLLADVVRNPAFEPSEVERLRGQQLSRISAEFNNPNAIGSRTLLPALYGGAHPYGVPPSGLGDPAVVAKVSRDDLLSFHQAWFRPEKARIVVVGDTTLAEVSAQLEKAFGTWAPSSAAAGKKSFDVAIPKAKKRIILVDRPKSPQSIILGGKVLDAKGSEDLVTLLAANEIYGGNFLSRINMNLRETKGWSYGVRSGINLNIESVPFIITAPVQSDRTGDSMKELIADLTAYLGPKGTTEEELVRTVNGNVRRLPGSFETGNAVFGGVNNILNYGRPDDYYEQLPATYAAMKAADVDAAGRAKLSVDDLLWVVVGDASVVKAQLEGLGMSIEVVPAPALK